jgi:chromosome segregation ATPase
MADDIGILYHKVNDLSERVTELESTRPFMQEMIEREIKVSEKLDATLDAVQLSMVQMNAKMDEQSKAIEMLQKNSVESNKKLNNRLDDLEERGQFDFLTYIKTNLPTIILTGVVVGAYVAKHFNLL